MKARRNRLMNILLCIPLTLALTTGTVLAEDFEEDMILSQEDTIQVEENTEDFILSEDLISSEEIVSSEDLLSSDDLTSSDDLLSSDDLSFSEDLILSEELNVSEGNNTILEAPVQAEIPEELTLEDLEADFQNELAMEKDLAPDSDELKVSSISDSSFDPEALFELYASKELGLGSDLETAQSFSGENLTGFNAKVYSELKKVIGQIANGSRTSTSITITMEDLGLPSRLYGSNLGIGKITKEPAYDYEATDNSTYEKVQEAIAKYLNYDPITVGWSVFRDCPAEFYWFDLTFYFSEPENSFAYSYDSTKHEYYVTCEVSFDFLVNEYFRGDFYFSVNPYYVSTLNLALRNANKIVSDAASLSDYDKLVYYRNKIVALNEYNYDVYYNMPESGYGDNGNPWQIIWVFDNDPNTNVVCEGYAKSFKYLCDKTNFEHANIQCYLMKGSFSSGYGWDLHMWNVLHMSDGKNYLVDITACDNGGSDVDPDPFMARTVGGSVADGYRIIDGDRVFTYVYDSETVGLFSTQQLTLSTTAFNKSKAELAKLATPVLTSVTNVKNGVTIKWGKVKKAQKYRVFRKVKGGKWTRIGLTTGTSFTDTTVVPGTKYSYTVRCSDITGTVYTSDFDTTGLSIKYLAKPALSSVTNDLGGVTFTWKASTGAAAYGVYRKEAGGTWQKLGFTTNTSYKDETAVSGKTYYYTVCCTNAAGKKNTSVYNTSGLKIQYIASPVLKRLTNVTAGLKLTWKASAGAAKYRIFRRVKGGRWTFIADTTATSYVDKTTTKGIKYYYTVRCLNAAGTAYTSFHDPVGLYRIRK